jgi:hypothetical protein
MQRTRKGVIMLERKYPQIIDSKGISHDAECFGSYTPWPCGKTDKWPECPLAQRCKNATPVKRMQK